MNSASATTSAKSKTAGIYNVDTRIYYMDNDYVALNNPEGVPVIVKRTEGPVSQAKISAIRKIVDNFLIEEAKHESHDRPG